MIVVLKRGLFAVAIALAVTLQSGCEILDKLSKSNNAAVTTPEASAEPAPQPAPVIEPFSEQPSNWRPILPHELDAHFEESEALLHLLRYSRRLGEMTSGELDEEYTALKKLSHEQKSSIGMQVKLALLLSTSAASFRDNERAKKILSGVINTEEKRGKVLKEYAYTLLVAIDQNEKAEYQNQQLRKKLKSEIERREQLEQKLEALKSIEESITQRQNNPEELAP